MPGLGRVKGLVKTCQDLGPVKGPENGRITAVVGIMLVGPRIGTALVRREETVAQSVRARLAPGVCREVGVAQSAQKVTIVPARLGQYGYRWSIESPVYGIG